MSEEEAQAPRILEENGPNKFYSNTSCSGDSDVVDGPTSGKNKINPKRYGAYKI
ncbi:hypothetical protein ACLX1H_009135 [Fusarium chlamydosporum]